ncbi:hypothetical protein CFIO01_11899 [Colletotrichum fioriniae PJ7]|uniref:Uncharacterized protein n=1 Tax=Colletotrichum fioriniae PJ7 TaxID=1445577 RepID=A0A010QF18_9PEZI|nr:hypothetical protein CFIO01_11899 [Colletotrichum fioriniae PJ7]
MERGASTAQGTFEAMILQRLPDDLPYLIPTWPDGLRTARAAHFCVPVTPHNGPTEQPYPADAMQQRLHTTDTHQTGLGSLPSRPIITSNQKSLAAHIISEPCGFSSRLCPMRPGRPRSRVAYSVRLSHLSEVQLR